MEIIDDSFQRYDKNVSSNSFIDIHWTINHRLEFVKTNEGHCPEEFNGKWRIFLFFFFLFEIDSFAIINNITSVRSNYSWRYSRITEEEPPNSHRTQSRKTRNSIFFSFFFITIPFSKDWTSGPFSPSPFPVPLLFPSILWIKIHSFTPALRSTILFPLAYLFP